MTSVLIVVVMNLLLALWPRVTTCNPEGTECRTHLESIVQAQP